MRVVDEGPTELVVLKPAGLACEVPRDPSADSVVRRLADRGYADLRLPHRLDAPASGLVLVARTRAAAAHYAEDIAARQWLKVYVARVAATAATASRLAGPHKAFLRTSGRRATVVRAGGKPSWLDLVGAFGAPETPREAHVVIRLRTGRFHQIRVMLAHLGLPLTGDVLYGGPTGRPFVLEHIRLGVRRADTLEWRTWTAPAHRDRDQWAPAVDAAVAAVTRDSPG